MLLYTQLLITGNCVLMLEWRLIYWSVWRLYLFIMDLSQPAKLQRGKTAYYSEEYRLLYLEESVVYPVIWADLCVMASVHLHGLPLLPPGRLCFKSVGYLPESHPAVIGRGREIKAKRGGQYKNHSHKRWESEQARMRDRQRERGKMTGGGL